MKLKCSFSSFIGVIIFVSVPQFAVIAATIINYSVLENITNRDIVIAGFSILYCLGLFVGAFIFCRKKILVRPIYSGIIFLGNLTFLVLFLLMLIFKGESYLDEYIFPLIGIFFALALTILYPLVAIVNFSSKSREIRLILLDILIPILIPFLFYYSIEVVVPLVYHRTGIDDEYLIFAAIIIAAGFFIFFFLRAIIKYFKLRIYSSKTGLFVGKLFALLIFPLLSFAVYFFMVSDIYNNRSEDAFMLEFLLLFVFIVSNAIIFIIPQLDNRIIRLLVFFLRTAMLMVTTLLFLLSLPFIPLVVILLVFAVGFALIGPYTMFAVSLKVFIQDIKYLKQFYSLLWIIPVAIMSFLTFPSIISVELVNQEQTLEKAVDYVFNYDLSEPQETDLNLNTLRRSLDNMEDYGRSKFSVKARVSGFFLTRDGELSREKMETIRKVFFNSHYYNNESRFRGSSPGTGLNNVAIVSDYNEKEQYWTSKIDLLIENTSSTQGEYRTNFELPEDVFISDYYLVVNGEKKKGTINEKKTAIWIYNSIVNRRKDPGLLHYNNDGSLTFKVFPVIKNEVRETGFTFIHKRPFNFRLDEKEYRVGNYSKTGNYSVRTSSHAIYIPAKEKQQLPLVSRKPYLHFLVDNSEMVTPELLGGYMDNIEEILNKYRMDDNYKVTFIGNRIVTIDSENRMEDRSDFPNPRGGFMLKRALSKCLYDNYTLAKMEYPVFILFTEDLENRYRENRLPLLTNPETDSIYHFEYNEFTELDIKTYEKRGKLSISDFEKYSKLSKPVYSWPDKRNPRVFLGTSNRDSIFYVDKKQSLVEMDLWSKGLEIYGADIYRQIHYTNMEGYRESVMKSKESSILSRNTAFIVLETAEQEELLKKREKKNLSNKGVEDFDGSMVSMTEPGDVFLIVFAILFCMYIVRKKLFVIKKK